MTAVLRREVDDLVVRLRRLVTERSLLERRGASAAELLEVSDELEQVRDELASRAKEFGDT
jgi:hypothetical protein